jgi:hypothetical protein
VTLPYSEGSVFLVPLRDGGYARGVVARANEEGKVLFGYFFGPRLSSKEDATLNGLQPANAIKRLMFGDLGLINGEWPIIGAIPNWNRSEWRMPDFVRRDVLGRLKPTLVRRSDDDPQRIQAEYLIEDAAGLEPDSLSGYGAVEIKLSKFIQ